MTDLSPRQWGKGDPEPPADVTVLRRPDKAGFAKRVPGGRGWWFVYDLDGTIPEGEDGWPWANNQVWPLTEVLPKKAPQYCPNTMERVDECQCIECVQPSQSSQDAPKPESPSGGQGSGETPASGDFMTDLVDIIQDNPTSFVRVDAESTAARVVEHFTAAGWRPPQTDGDLAGSLHVDGEDGTWYVRILDEPVHRTTEGSPVNIDWTIDGTMIGVEILGSADQEPEWEWGKQWPGGQVESLGTSRRAALDAARFGARLVRRRVSPWEQVEQS